jgi:hypothetical protein
MHGYFQVINLKLHAYLIRLFNHYSNKTYNLKSNFDHSQQNLAQICLKKSLSYRAAKPWDNLPFTLTQIIGNKAVNVFIIV